jgi:hypothetical protein
MDSRLRFHVDFIALVMVLLISRSNIMAQIQRGQATMPEQQTTETYTGIKV